MKSSCLNMYNILKPNKNGCWEGINDCWADENGYRGLRSIAGLLLFIWFLPQVTQSRKNYCRGHGYFAHK
jgi:hypothetical protein